MQYSLGKVVNFVPATAMELSRTITKLADRTETIAGGNIDMNKLVVEKEDKYILPLEGKTVFQCRIDNRFSIMISSKDEPEIGVQIAAGFLLIENGKEQKFAIENYKEIGPAFQIFEKKVKSAYAFKKGELEINFDDGLQLRVNADTNYEPWEIYGNDGLHIVSNPGGELAIWSGSIYKLKPFDS